MRSRFSPVRISVLILRINNSRTPSVRSDTARTHPFSGMGAHAKVCFKSKLNIWQGFTHNIACQPSLSAQNARNERQRTSFNLQPFRDTALNQSPSDEQLLRGNTARHSAASNTRLQSPGKVDAYDSTTRNMPPRTSLPLPRFVLKTKRLNEPTGRQSQAAIN